MGADHDRPAPVVSYVLRSVPIASETFVVRELLALRDAGADVEIWSLLPAPESPWAAMPEAAPLRPLVREVPGGRLGWVRLLRSLAGALARRPPRTARAIVWALWWALRGRDPRTIAALPYAAWIARHARAPHLHAHFANTPTTVAVLASMLSGRTCSYTGHARDLWAVTTPAFLGAKTARCTFAASGTRFALDRIRAACGPGRTPELVLVPSIVPQVDDVDERTEDRGGGAGRRSRSDLERGATPTGTVPRADDGREPGLVVCVARLVEKKGVDTLIRAVAEAGRSNPVVHLEIVGDGPCRAELEKLADSFELADRVTFRGALSSSQVESTLARAEVFALLARATAKGDTDALPVALLEAQAHGLPVVSTPIAGIPEAVEDEVTGILVPPNDPTAAASALGRLIDDAALRARLGTGARRAIVDRHDGTRSVAELLPRFAGRASAVRGMPSA